MNNAGFATRSEQRLIWATTRSLLEADNYKHRKYGKKVRRQWSLFEGLIQVFGMAARCTPLYRRGLENARRIVLKGVDLEFADLPQPFDGYTILHLTDLHLDFAPGIAAAVCQKIRGLAVDLCVLTGDYRAAISGGFKQILDPMGQIVSSIRAKDGIYATLGNHDSYMMVDCFEQMGMTVMANESTEIAKDGSRIWVTGLDDPYYYYTDQAIRALEETPDGFKIALVHAPSLYDDAAANGYRLYLSGHTHGGQICLPGGRPVIVHLRHGRRLYRGIWRHGQMAGYTSQGAGTVGIPLRFNTESEITVFRLNCGPVRAA